MGHITVEIGISDGNGGDTYWIEALVDTGATFTSIPASFLREKVGLCPKGEELEFELADDKVVSLPVGEAVLNINGIERTNTVVFGPEGEAMLGVVALQNVGLIPDTTNHELIPAKLRL